MPNIDQSQVAETSPVNEVEQPIAQDTESGEFTDIEFEIDTQLVDQIITIWASDNLDAASYSLFQEKALVAGVKEALYNSLANMLIIQIAVKYAQDTIQNKK